MTRNVPILFLLVAALPLVTSNLEAQERLLEIDDLFRIKRVGTPNISPEGTWVAYTVSTTKLDDDSSDTDIYMASLQSGDHLQVTTSEKSESSPEWSPDGRYLAFLSARDGKKNQVWLLDRRGGEARRLTDFKGGVSEMAWSPDSGKLALVVRDADPKEEETKKEGTDKDKPKPIVVTRLQFKRDGSGYLNDLRRHIYVFEIESKQSTQLTEGSYDDGSPVWSPDGRWIAFVSNRTPEPDANANTDLFLVPTGGGELVQVTTSESSDSSPVFSPEGSLIAYLTDGDPADIWYATNDLAVVEVLDGQPGQRRILTEPLDRNLRSPVFAPDGASILFTLEDNGNVHLASIPVGGGPVTRILAGERTVSGFDVGPEGKIAVLEGQLHYPAEISMVDAGELARLTTVNDEFLTQVRLAPVRRFQAESRDGTIIEAFLTLPPEQADGRNLPTLLRIHGGPVSQFSNQFSFEWQLFAAHGYAVVAANPRGSSGRGRDFSYAIWADWGNKDFEDVMAAVDWAVEQGIADPERLGVGGWSYGGILTNYVITQTGRFKTAISGASEVNYTANYGHDHYQRQWEAELGLPWENTEAWLTISPFFKVAQITTPTLVMCGQVDWNVPLQNSEQLYQALRRRGIDTELVIYPGQSHGIRLPSFQKDRYQRYLAWYDTYLKPETTTSGDAHR